MWMPVQKTIMHAPITTIQARQDAVVKLLKFED